ncbi:Uncharacterised protein [Mycobacterium tuberculosis]|nr:Uncharacterised protein [Mycobacterium tuberculosis]
MPGYAAKASTTSMIGKSCPANRERSPAVVTAATGTASPSMNATRGGGFAGSIGRYAAPVLSTATIATTAGAHRSNSSATHSPGPAPQPASRCANRLDASSSSRYVIAASPQHTASASGIRATWAANICGIDTGVGAGAVSTARLPHSSNRARSVPSSASIDDTVRSGAAATATNTFRNRSISTSIAWASNTSVRYSTAPPIPAGSLPSLKRSANENTKSMRAVRVSIGIGVACRSPKFSCPTGLSCQANITWISG